MSILGLVPAKKTIYLSVILSTLIFASIIHGAAAEPSLVQAISERLSYMEDVGAYKAQNKIPVEDVEREKIVLSKAKELAAAHGLDHNSMERFSLLK